MKAVGNAEPRKVNSAGGSGPRRKAEALAVMSGLFSSQEPSGPKLGHEEGKFSAVVTVDRG